MRNKRTWIVVVVFALAMAWVESAVVFYLRVMIDRVVPYQPDPLPGGVGAGFAVAELVRELATLVMLGSVGWLAGHTWRSRAGYAMLAFGAWDLGYYAFLKVLTGWPHSLLDWDILFLLPLPWWGPVLAPAAIAALMVVLGSLVGMGDRPERPLWPGRTAWLLNLAGVAVALYVFMADALRAAGGGIEALRTVLPLWFNWPLFGVALVLLAVPLVDVVRQMGSRHSSTPLSAREPARS
jgi:hypothetical protein